MVMTSTRTRTNRMVSHHHSHNNTPTHIHLGLPDIKREMQICHTQPHLVPPMRLVVYDDLPNSPIQPRRASTLPSRMMTDGKNLVSRASSIRASMSIRRKSGIHAPPPPPAVHISAPSDFRRVQSSSAIGINPNNDNDNDDKDRFQPLELSIYNSSKYQLSNLPSFENFGVEPDSDNNGAAPPVLTRPARAFSSASLDAVSRSRRSNASFHLPRKPVGSGSRRASSVATLEQLLERKPQAQPQSQAAATNPLIPHFASTRPSSSSIAQPRPQPQVSTPEPVILQDRPLPRTPSTEENETETPPPPSTTEGTKPSPPTRSLRSGCVAQWLFPTPPSSSNVNTNIPFSLSPPTSPTTFKSHCRHHSRTLSGSTLASQPQSQSQASPYPVSGGKYHTHNNPNPTTTYTTITPSFFSSGTFTSTTTAATLRDSSDIHNHTPPPPSPVPSSYPHAGPPAGAGADSDQTRKGKKGLDTAVSSISRPAALDDIHEGEQMMPPRGFI